MGEFATFTAEEQSHVTRILDRAAALYRARHRRLNRLSLEMDLAATHATLPLRLADLAAASDFDFTHDVFGIIEHLNRLTGRLDDHFIPRFARRNA